MGIVKDLCWAVFKEEIYKKSKQESPKPIADETKSSAGTSDRALRADNIHPVVYVCSSPGEVYYNRYYSNEEVRFAKLIMEEYYKVENPKSKVWENVTDFTRKHWLDYTLAVKRVMAREENRDGWSNK